MNREFYINIDVLRDQAEALGNLLQGSPNILEGLWELCHSIIDAAEAGAKTLEVTLQ